MEGLNDAGTVQAHITIKVICTHPNFTILQA